VVKKQSCILAISLLIVLFSGCKKSEGTKIKNFFGASPEISDLSITKERKDFSCPNTEDLCTCCCAYMAVQNAVASLDRVTVSARVTDPTAPNNADILVVVVHFLDPPPSTGISQINQIALQMFDDGSVTLGTIGTGAQITSGDLQAGDGIYTREFYFPSTNPQPNSCPEDTDQSQIGHTFSTYATVQTVGPSETLAFTFSVQAIDKSGNIDTSTGITLPIQGSVRNTEQNPIPCGPSNGSGGCFPP
jgi:hypothetical protein